MAVSLPPGRIARTPALTDAIAGFVGSYTHSIAGFADYTVADARDELHRAGL